MDIIETSVSMIGVLPCQTLAPVVELTNNSKQWISSKLVYQQTRLTI